MQWHRRRRATKRSAKIPSALRVAGPTALLLCCSSSPMPYIDSSSRLESEPFRPQQMACYWWDRTLKHFGSPQIVQMDRSGDLSGLVTDHQ